ncbi:alpha/beta hydrolase [Dyella flagellata]|uniref:Alpha/beta hydrolase n=1 Tax=Dyella flagellata TaxID=1867833 RepID=A0ABQ5XCS3_9GAMM|nr:alpha/beta hydrolase [Dyella flagellata]GLQ89011.1 hypothetical protein GCM10007898_25830 [Dyella flagellata]
MSILFINLRASPSGGMVAGEATSWDDGTRYVSPQEFANRIAGRNVVFVTHGFNVDQANGIQDLTTWSDRYALPDSWIYVGILWPGDCRLEIFVDYVYEGPEAISSGQLLANYLNQYAKQAQSYSFVAHSLGARMVLEAVRGLESDTQCVVLMAGAIEDDCFAREYADAAAKISRIHVVASRCDRVLEWAFPAGNLIGEIVMHGHPYDRSPLGRNGPARPTPPNLSIDSWQIPDGWNFGHTDYLPGQAIAPELPLPVPAPGPDSGVPVDLTNLSNEVWKPAWSAGAATTFLLHKP